MTTTTNNSTKFNVTFGIYGVDAVPANAAVLLHDTRKNVGGEYKVVTEFLAIEGVRSTKTTDLVMPVLAVMLADIRKRNGFACEYKTVVLNGEEIDSKLRAKSCFTKWLKSNVLYKSNGEGVLNKALVMDEGLRLSSTALKISEKQPIFAASGSELRVIMHKTAEAITKQASMFSGIIKDARAIFASAYEDASKKATKKADDITAKAA